MTPYESDATKGSAAKPLAKRAVSVVKTRTRTHPLVSRAAVCVTLNGLHVRDPDTSPSKAVDMAVRAGELVQLVPRERDRVCLGLPEPEVFRAAFEDPTPEEVRATIREEADGLAREAWVGALNALAQEVDA